MVEAEDGQLYFVEPYEVAEDFSSFLDYLQLDSSSAPAQHEQRVVRYAQTRKCNRRDFRAIDD